VIECRVSLLIRSMSLVVLPYALPNISQTVTIDTFNVSNFACQ
jgi:hypothetical protein